VKAEKISFLGNYIYGQFKIADKSDGRFKDISPSDLSDEVMEVSYSHDDVDLAIGAAKKAYVQWSRLQLQERKVYLLKLKDIFEKRKNEIAQAISRDTGKPTWEALTEASALINKIDITLEFSSRLIAEFKVENALPQVDGFVRYKPRGVMSVIGPFNFPAHLPNGHIIPALLVGNTIVYKPSEQTPFVGQIYSQCFHEAGFPLGVYNMVHGDGETGRKIVVHEHIDGVLFTGSYEVGLKIKQETLNHYWKILALEMGGKNTTVVWEDADLDKAIYESLIGSYLSCGQRCSGTSRIIVHSKLFSEFAERFYQAAKKITIGHWTENVFMGPLINGSAIEKYVRFQEIANREGHECMMRGKPLDLKHKGHYVTPSIHIVKNYDPKSVYQKSEIFGPNVSLLMQDNFDEILQAINSTGYGLAMALFSKDRKIYEQALLEAKVGILNWNRTTNGASSKLPFGGMGKSGNDRPSADFAIQYCAVPVATLEDRTTFDKNKILPGIIL